jgi:bacillithiol system protein YtxJ
MSWIPLQEPDQLQTIVDRSAVRPQVIFKHSTRCNISSLALQRLQRSGLPPHIDFYLLDLIQYRQLSNQVAEQFGVWHESPQVLLIKNGKCVYDESHMGISMDELLKQAAS